MYEYEAVAAPRLLAAILSEKPENDSKFLKIVKIRLAIAQVSVFLRPYKT